MLRLSKMEKQNNVRRSDIFNKWTFAWIIGVILLLATTVTAWRLRVNSIEAIIEDLSPVFDKTPIWQETTRNLSRHYDAGLIRASISDFQAKHSGRLPELEEITKSSKDENTLVWHYVDLSQISDPKLLHYDEQEFVSGAFTSPTSGESFYGAPLFDAPPALPDEENIHIWLGYTCVDSSLAAGLSYTDLVSSSTAIDFAIVYALEDSAKDEVGDGELTGTPRPTKLKSLTRCLGGDSHDS